VFSKLMLILSVSPLFAPTVGSFISTTWGWRAVFFSLAAIVLAITVAVFFFLPDGRPADPTVSLRPRAIFGNFVEIFRHPRFLTYAVTGAFSFAGLFAYLAAAPSIFLGTFHLSERQFGLVFAALSVGVVGGGQLNLFFLRRFKMQDVFRAALYTQVAIAAIFLAGPFLGGYGLATHILLFFLYLSCAGLTSPNASALALAPFANSAGSAAALLGFLQMTVGSLAAAAFGLLTYQVSLSLGILFAATSLIGFSVFVFNQRREVSGGQGI
jgi:DHA1 family bicyclomycin/chloramphenicol resistance-like MFS transporter